jgi:hypothetical protein
MNNFYFLNLDIPLFKEGITFQDIPKTSIAKIDEVKYLNEKIFMFFDSLGLKIFFVETFFKTPEQQGGIHIDGVGGDCTKLNWVFNGGSSKMGWYRPINNILGTKHKTATGTSYTSYSRNQVDEIEHCTIQNPTLVQVGIPHCIFDVTEDRFCVSILFKNKISNQIPTMNESVQIFKKYIETTGSE